jgi:hypothetical protein
MRVSVWRAIAAMLLAAPAAATTPSLSELSWLIGTWQEERNGVVARETWLAPLGGVMAGVGITSRPQKATVLEFTRITVEPAGLTFTASPVGQATTAFTHISSGPSKVVFENKNHDFPQRVIYERCGEDLCARIEGTVDGKLTGQNWRYRRVTSTATQ